MEDKKIRALTPEEEGSISGGVYQKDYNKEHGTIKIIRQAYGGPEPKNKKTNKKDDLTLK